MYQFGKKEIFLANYTYQFTDPVQHQVYDLFSNGVVTTGVVVSRVLFTSDQLLRVEKLAVGPSTNLIWERENGNLSWRIQKQCLFLFFPP